ncbi:LPS export ABC transporter permease LptG [Pasteurellaceae bacterium HPA106]|uniref:LPS export ABC transporter permease LptG n=1 Tax=Spirabiliibacterium pneumoniae TaxID=221400 RepID=UPI001AACB19D|nr:LPS export ABC transporter permease LptG [Spirabiliibacterium pneumoniae]MBE2896588.1 LPS export ABC transporter permease LptG [Spirabiliibacterium pneumoniae]
MFGVLDRYIGKTILGTILASLLMLVGLSAIIKFVEQFRDIGKGSYDGLQAVYYTLLTMPRDIETFFPMAVLLGALIGLGTLAANSELVVMQASGFSRLKIGLATIKTAIPLVLIIMLLGEWGIPQTEQFARNMRSQAMSGGSLISVKNGIWAKDGNNFVYIQQINDANTLKNIYIYQFDGERKLKNVQYANEATFDPQQQQWVFNRLNETIIGQDKIDNKNYLNRTWASSLTPDKLMTVSLKASSLSISGLYNYASFLKQSGQDPTQFELLFWRKLVQPFSVGVMVLLALSFIFGPLRSVTAGARIVTGIISGFVFYVINETFGKVTMVFDIPPVVGALLPSVLFLLITWWILKRKRT